MEKKSVLILIGALLLAGATAATAYSRFASPQEVSQGTYPGTAPRYTERNGMMGGGVMGRHDGMGLQRADRYGRIPLHQPIIPFIPIIPLFCVVTKYGEERDTTT